MLTNKCKLSLYCLYVCLQLIKKTINTCEFMPHMNFIALQLVIITFVKCLLPVLVKGRCEQDPYDICMSSGGVGVVVTPENLKCLTQMLKRCKIDCAYVYGLDNYRAMMLLSSHGLVTKYDPRDIKCNYAFVMQEEPNYTTNVVAACNFTYRQPCCNNRLIREGCKDNRRRVKVEVCAKESQIFCDDNSVQRDTTCEPLSITQATKQMTNKCQSFPQVRMTEQTHEVPGCDSITKKLITATSKTYQYLPMNNNKFSLTTLEEEQCALISTRVIDRCDINKHCDIPKILHNPDTLVHIKRCIQHEYKCKVCIYITNDSCVYTILNDHLYKIECDTHDNITVHEVDYNTMCNVVNDGLYEVRL